MSLQMPVTQADPHKGLVPTAYVFRQRRQHCQRCGYWFEALDLFAETWIRRDEPGAKPIRNFRPMHGDAPKWRVPIRTEKAPIEKLMFCSECSDGYAVTQTLADPPSIGKRILSVAPRNPEAALAAARSASAPRKHKRQTSIDDLFGQL